MVRGLLLGSSLEALWENWFPHGFASLCVCVWGCVRVCVCVGGVAALCIAAMITTVKEHFDLPTCLVIVVAVFVATATVASALQTQQP